MHCPVGTPQSDEALLRLVSTPQGTSLISFEYSPLFPIHVPPRQRLDLAPIAALPGAVLPAIRPLHCESFEQSAP
jgi:hypothetical protein